MFHCHGFLPGDYSNLPGELSKQVAAQFLHRNRHSDSRCNNDQKYCERNRDNCMVRYRYAIYYLDICLYVTKIQYM